MENKKVSKWIDEDDGYFSYRFILGTDPEDVKNRVAAIEKTPRVRIAEFTTWQEDCHNWESNRIGEGGSCEGSTCKELGIYGSHQRSREWCDKRLVELGYDLQ